MEIHDSDNLLLVLFSIISVIYLGISSIWAVEKTEKVLDVLYMTAVTGLSFMIIHNYYPDAVPISVDLKTGGVTTIIIILWIALFKIGPAVAKFLVYVFTIFIIIPLVFYQNSAVISSYLSSLLGIEVSVWFGFFIVMVIFILLGYLVYRIKLFDKLKSLAYLAVCAFLIFYSIRLAIIEGPAPEFNNIQINCFDENELDKCPFGFEKLYSILLLGIFTFVIMLRLLCLRFCMCSKETQKEQKKEKEKEPKKEKKKKEKKETPKTKTKQKQKYTELVEEEDIGEDEEIGTPSEEYTEDGNETE